MSRSVIRRALLALLLTAGTLVALPAPAGAAVLAPNPASYRSTPSALDLNDYCLDEPDMPVPRTGCSSWTCCGGSGAGS